MKEFKGFKKGVNLGGWISQFAKYDKAHFESFITEKDIENIASLGFDHVRVPVDYNVLEDEAGNVIETGFGYLESCRQWCEKYNLNMLIDLHECFGYSFDPLKKDDKIKFFYDAPLQERFLKLWREIATRFAPYTDRIAFEPLNEVVSDTVVDAWNDLAGRYIKMMREIVPDAWLVIGGVCYNSVMSVPLLDIPVDDKVVYNFHCYEPFAFTHQGAYWVDNMPSDFRISYPENMEIYREKTKALPEDLTGAIYKIKEDVIGPKFFDSIFAPAVEAADKAGVPLYCGEYGAIDLADNAGKINWLRDIHTAFEKHAIGHALWNYKEKDFGLVDDSFAEIREDFIKIV
ncbi:MAG: glycoside hydrolase family 5 protein [Lachnospiraceae bacterium]|nr:glycoside hydrolase family 5 protein [Lachnospiraceae bacterium]